MQAGCLEQRERRKTLRSGRWLGRSGLDRSGRTWGGRIGREPALVRASGARQQACTDCNEPKVSRHDQLLLGERESVLTAPLRAPHAMLKRTATKRREKREQTCSPGRRSA